MARSEGVVTRAVAAVRRYRRRMEVQLLSFDGCPNWRIAEGRLREALVVVSAPAEVALVNVPTPEEAERLSFRGSPTILLDGTEPFAGESAPVGLS